uniref:Serine/threonine-protein kinase RIO1 n=1 Tax=Aegilops tauschii TaxID=37682 RepID=R7W2Q8_AEGTA
MATAAATATSPLHDSRTFALQQGELDGRFADAEEKPAAPSEEPAEAEAEEDEDDDEDEDEEYWSYHDVGEALDWLDAAEGPDGSTRLSSTFSAAGSAAAARRPNAHGGMLARTLQPLSNRTQKLASHVRAAPLEEWEGRMNVGMSNSVTTAIRDSIRDTAIGKTRNTGKADRATVEQAIDPRTRMVLFKMLNRGVFNNINGCISTGKEANVYHATKTDGSELAIKVYKTSVLVFKDRDRYVQGDYRFRHGYCKHNPRKMANVYHATKTDGSELAIKVYKTSVLVFKDRDRYVQGDYRFRHGYCKHNPRKMVKTWAEKEMRNLLRVRAEGIRCPKPLLLRLHVLVMEFIGKGGWAAPRLKDAALSDDKLRETYFEGHLYIIDVSQSVDLDHPSALDFLKEDCLHVNVQQKILENGDTAADDDEIAPTVLVQTLDYVKQCEADIVSMSMMQRPSVGYEPTADKLYDQPLLGFVRAKNEPTENQEAQPAQKTREEPLDLQTKCSLENKEEDESGDSESCSSSDEDGSWHESTKMGPEERKAARKENKKKVKEEKRETRKTKIPKADKKKRKKMAKAKCKR